MTAIKDRMLANLKQCGHRQSQSLLFTIIKPLSICCPNMANMNDIAGELKHRTRMFILQLQMFTSAFLASTRATAYQ